MMVKIWYQGKKINHMQVQTKDLSILTARYMILQYIGHWVSM